MKRALVFLILLLASPVLADSVGEQFKRGNDAYNKGNYATALKEWRPLAEQGDAFAQDNLGLMYRKGQGVTQDDAEAVRWYRKAADQGDADAQSFLGVMYTNGEGVTQDYQAALGWYCKAIKQGHSGAMGNLGFMYENGYGVVQDYAQAHKWFNLAAARGKGEDRERNVKNRDIATKKMTTAAINEAQRLAREWTPDKPCP